MKGNTLTLVKDAYHEIKKNVKTKRDIVGLSVIALVVLEILSIISLIWDSIRPGKKLSRFELFKSPAFSSIVSCAVRGEGVGCFEKLGPRLVQEAQYRFSAISQEQLERYLNSFIFH
ncbi:unnamed protein product [Kuraishia capsulata CBS 1993]|uniref:Uncharacterized protein n=1 Tax=Kuraishia capsulata CBS 1993 TaxID=1382522 RepID=W6MJ76_9ASCO|nr:uncharacterized protein KUCA_T00000445001 [Kuraishia capsulata CBS 1993]CDK24482.1 unnamed protein product [Kuraishia capsulata CBS 1993]